MRFGNFSRKTLLVLSPYCFLQENIVLIPKLVAALFVLSALAPSQTRRVDQANTHERIICVVPMVGAGTPLVEDEKRPFWRFACPSDPAWKAISRQSVSPLC